MSVVEDVRKVLQDFIAPEMRELKAPMDAQEKRLDAIDGRIEKLRSETDSNFKDQRMETMLGFREVQVAFKELRNDLRLSERLERVEKAMLAEHKQQ